MSDRVIIRDLRKIEIDGWTELSAEVDGERLWYRVPVEVDIAVRAEPFVAAALFEAMFRGVPLDVEKGIPLSPFLYEKLQEIQTIYRCWNRDLNVVPVSADLVEAECKEGSVGSLFSAGVDSSHTLLRHRDEVDTLFLILGFEEAQSELDWKQRIADNRQFADKMNKKLIIIKTNARVYSQKRGINWMLAHGAFLATIAPLLKYQTLLIPSSHTYEELFPWGSHPLCDPMWSTGVNKIVHDAAGFRRSEKMRDLCTDQQILDNLQVCRRSSDSNCGACFKCVRTMLALHLLGAECKKLPVFKDDKLLRYLKATDQSGETFLEDAIILAKQQGDLKIYRQLKRYYKRYQMSKIIPLLDRTLLNGLLRKLYRRLRKPEWLTERVSLRTKDRWIA